jgi:hypothetical protein
MAVYEYVHFPMAMFQEQNDGRNRDFTPKRTEEIRIDMGLADMLESARHGLYDYLPDSLFLRKHGLEDPSSTASLVHPPVRQRHGLYDYLPDSLFLDECTAKPQV